MKTHILLSFFTFFTLSNFQLQGQILDNSWRNLSKDFSKEWLTSKEAKETANRVLLYQRNNGGWPKNIHPQKELDDKKRENLLQEKNNAFGATIDNGATTVEMIFLAHLHQFQPNTAYIEAFKNGLNYILEAQYPSGGWPQFYPTKKESYYRHITYNDDAMVNVLKLLQKIKNQESPYIDLALSSNVLQKVDTAIQKGIQCILDTQYKQGDKLTAWCAQHDRNTLEPAKARSYELPSLSGKESAQITLFLMSLVDPSEEIIKAVKSAVLWFQNSKIEDVREIRHYNNKGKLTEKTLEIDFDANPIWARFMELESNVPFFCDRDGIKKSSYDQIGNERRIGYAWYTQEPQQVLDQYPNWLSRISKQKVKKKDLYEMVVSKDGTGDFSSVQAAINHAKSFPYQRVNIHIKNGIYNEKILVPKWNPMVSLIGENQDSTILRFGDFFDKIDKGRNSTFYTATLQVEGNDFYATNLTIENNAGEIGQAIALSIQADRVKIENCTIKGHQDTFYAAGEGNRVYINNSRIAGSTDFIFGEATVLFDSCEIKSLTNSYITAASTPKGIQYGFVFLNCTLTAKEKVKNVYLGRPWRTYAKTVFINCHIGNHIVSEGWHNWGNEAAEKESVYGEFNSLGPGANSKERVSWSKQLSAEEAKLYTKQNILREQSQIQSNDWYNYKIKS